MRKRIVIMGVVVMALCVLLILRSRQRDEQKVRSGPDVAVLHQEPTDEAVPPRTPANLDSNAPKPPVIATSVASPDPRSMDSNAFYQWWLTAGQVPIDFYGKVIDENSNVIAGATVSFSWHEDRKARSHISQSDADGLFSLHGARGTILEAAVSKEGYYTPRPGFEGFVYAVSGHFSPDPLNPVIFKLRKRGQGAELITSENGIRLNVAVRVPKDNAPIRVDLLQKQSSPAGQLEISQNKPPWKDATDWSFRVSIRDGGFVENEDEFQFQAPETNYKPAVEYHFTKSDSNWTTHFVGSYYIAFGDPRRYGWLRIESVLAQETVFLTYAINPTGSRNLEPK